MKSFVAAMPVHLGLKGNKSYTQHTAGEPSATGIMLTGLKNETKGPEVHLRQAGLSDNHTTAQMHTASFQRLWVSWSYEQEQEQGMCQMQEQDTDCARTHGHASPGPLCCSSKANLSSSSSTESPQWQRRSGSTASTRGLS